MSETNESTTTISADERPNEESNAMSETNESTSMTAISAEERNHEEIDNMTGNHDSTKDATIADATPADAAASTTDEGASATALTPTEDSRGTTIRRKPRKGTISMSRVKQIAQDAHDGKEGAVEALKSAAASLYEDGWAKVKRGRTHKAAIRSFEKCVDLVGRLNEEVYPELSLVLAVLNRWRIDDEAADLGDLYVDLDLATVDRVRELQSTADTATFERLNILLGIFEVEPSVRVEALTAQQTETNVTGMPL